MTYWKYAPAVGAAGKVAAEFLDETGSIGLQNTALKKFAFGVNGHVQNLANKIGGNHLMKYTDGNWKDEFKRILGDLNSEIHFDLTDVTHSGKINFEELSSIISNPKSNTQWEISTLYSEFNEKFNNTIFHYNGKEYKGNEIFNIKE